MHSWCNICGKAFATSTNMKVHCDERTHTGMRSFQCDVCEKSFTQRPNLVVHQMTHTGENRIYQCDVCGKMLSLEDHIEWNTHWNTLFGSPAGRVCLKYGGRSTLLLSSLSPDKHRHKHTHTHTHTHTHAHLLHVLLFCTVPALGTHGHP